VPESAASADLAFFRQTGLELAQAHLMAAARRMGRILDNKRTLGRDAPCVSGNNPRRSLYSRQLPWMGRPSVKSGSSPLALPRLSP